MQLKLATDFPTPQEMVSMRGEFRNEVKSLLSQVLEHKLLERPIGCWSLSEVGEHLYLTQMNFAHSLPIVLAGKVGELDEQKNLDYKKIRNYFFKLSRVKNPESVAPLNNYSQGELFPLLDKSQKKIRRGYKNSNQRRLTKTWNGTSLFWSFKHVQFFMGFSST